MHRLLAAVLQLEPLPETARDRWEGAPGFVGPGLPHRPMRTIWAMLGAAGECAGEATQQKPAPGKLKPCVKVIWLLSEDVQAGAALPCCMHAAHLMLNEGRGSVLRWGPPKNTQACVCTQRGPALGRGQPEQAAPQCAAGGSCQRGAAHAHLLQGPDRAGRCARDQGGWAAEGAGWCGAARGWWPATPFSAVELCVPWPACPKCNGGGLRFDWGRKKRTQGPRLAFLASAQ